jgi:hypothetical protein
MESTSRRIIGAGEIVAADIELLLIWSAADGYADAAIAEQSASGHAPGGDVAGHLLPLAMNTRDDDERLRGDGWIGLCGSDGKVEQSGRTKERCSGEELDRFRHKTFPVSND